MQKIELLRDRYLELTNHILPQAAQQRSFPVKYNHCFQRIILDNVVGCCWYKVLDRKKGAAYLQLNESQLQAAITLAESILAQPDRYLHQLNQASLRWRGKL